MKHFLLFATILLFPNVFVLCQKTIESNSPNKSITLLQDKTYEIKEFTWDSLLIYKGTLSSVDPEVRNGKFDFFDNKGKVIATGFYKKDIPHGVWVYYNELYDTLKTINYTSVWDYLEKDALDFTVDFEIIKALKKKGKVSINPDGTFYEVEKLPTFKNGDPLLEFNKYITENMIYPIYAARKEIQGATEIQFIIDSKGKIRNPYLTSPLISDLSMEAVRILSQSPIWEPGYQKGIPVNVNFSWIFSFDKWSPLALNPSTLKKDGASESSEVIDGDIFFIVEDMPTFNGGEPAKEFTKYIFQNLRYPDEAAENGISGRVIIQFMVNTEGKLTNPQIVVSADPLLDQEAIRLINSSPLWKPGYQRGKPVNVLFTFPMNFILQ